MELQKVQHRVDRVDQVVAGVQDQVVLRVVLELAIKDITVVIVVAAVTPVAVAEVQQQ